MFDDSTPFQPQSRLSLHELLRFFPDEEQTVVPAGTVVILEDEPGNVMYVLLEGQLLVTAQGKRVHTMMPGAIFGEMALIDDRPRSATVTAVTDSRLIAIDGTRFQEIVGRSPQFALHVMYIMATRTRRLVQEEVQRQRMEEELVIGRRIQLSLLPPGCPEIPGYEFASDYRAAREVGGDLYDFIIPPDDATKVHMVIADVTGKGVPAALYMAVSRTLLHNYALADSSPGEALRRVNAFIGEDNATPLFLSAVYGVLDSREHILTYANAGHNAPIWIHHQTGGFEPLVSRGLVLGSFKTFEADEKFCRLEPGDYVVFFTDGITEARNLQGEFFDDEGLEAVIASSRWNSAGELLEAIVGAVDDFSRGTPKADDHTVIVLRRSPAN